MFISRTYEIIIIRLGILCHIFILHFQKKRLFKSNSFFKFNSIQFNLFALKRIYKNVVLAIHMYLIYIYTFTNLEFVKNSLLTLKLSLINIHVSFVDTRLGGFSKQDEVHVLISSNFEFFFQTFFIQWTIK